MFTRTRDARKGIVLIWVAVLAFLIVGISGLAVDAAYMFFAGHQLQVAADSAARAGAIIVHRDSGEVQQLCRDVALQNIAAGEPVQLSGDDIELGVYTPPESLGSEGTFVVTLDSPNAVKVTARRTTGSPGGPVGIFFGRIFGKDTVNVSRFAIGVQDLSGGAGLIVLHANDPCSLDMDSNARILVNNGGLQVNSDHNQALCMDSNAAIQASPVNVVGGSRLRSNANVSGALSEGASVLDDPLADLPVPVPGPDLGEIALESNETRTVDPGYYSGGINLDSNTVLNLNPGLYVLDGVGLKMRSNTSLRGTGVTIYVKNEVNPAAAIDIDSNGDIELTPPESGPYENVVLWQARDNTNDAVINSNGYVDVKGALYISNPTATLHMDSNGQVIGNAVLAHKIHMDSNAEISIDETGLFGLPSSSYLVR